VGQTLESPLPRLVWGMKQQFVFKRVVFE
jgi:hypothetical protein